MESVIQILYKHEILSQTVINGFNYFLAQKRLNQEPNNIERINYKLKCPTKVPLEKVQKINEQIKKINESITLTQQLGVGEKMADYLNLHKVFSEQKCDLIHNQGQVLLVDVWATWCGPCQEPMKHNQQMLEKNQQTWKDKVRIVAVSVDQEKQTIINRINTQGWNKISHLTFLGWDQNHNLIKDFKIQGIPFVFLVDKFGVIRYTGHPSYTNLEQMINNLINQDKQPEQNKNEEKTDNKDQNFCSSIISQLKKLQQIKKIFNKQSINEKFGKAQLFSASARMSKLSIAKNKIENCKFQIKVCAYEQDKQLLDQFKQLLTNIDPQIFSIQNRIIQCQNVPNVQNPQCIECKTKLSYPYYWCKWDLSPNSLRCRQCVEKKPGKGHFNYLNNCVLLNGPLKRIPVKGFGHNIQPEDISKIQDIHYFGCNGGCGVGTQTVQDARYICLACRSDPNPFGDYVDVCRKCFENYLKGDEKVRTTLNVQGHNETHPLLRILYNVKGYYQF